MIRAFLAFDLAKAVKENLGQWIRSLEPQMEGIRWSNPSDMHCTLKFFGDIDEGVLLDSVSDLLVKRTQSFSSVPLHCVGVGVFPNWKYPRVLWSGFTGATETVLQWHDQIEHDLLPFKIAPDPRQF